MKHIQIRFILCAMFAFSSFHLIEAQTSTDNGTDSLSSTRNSMVQVAYRKVPLSDLLGGVSVVNMEELTNKNYNTYSLDNMQGYIGGWSGNSMWGTEGYLVLVDGVPRDANNVDPTEIQQISFLKGASSVVLYGSRAAKGVVLITTKRGKVGDSRIDVRANTGFYVPKSTPKYLGSAEYMTLYNEAQVNDGGLIPKYTNDAIYNHSTGSNPYRYSNIDFYSSDYLKSAYNRSDVTAEISGGNDRARYYTNIGYYNQDDLFKFGQAKNNSINRLNLRGNVDFTLSDAIKAYVNANATFYNTRSAKGNYWTAATTLRPNQFAPLVPISFIDKNDVSSMTLINNSGNIIDGKYFLGGTQSDLTNIFADTYAAGSSRWTSRQFQFDTGVDIDLKGLLKGLTFKGMFAVDYATTYTLSYDNTYAILVPSWANYNGSDVISSLKKENVDKKSGNQNVSGTTDKQTVAFSGQFNYATSINNTHNISASLVAAGFQQTQSEVYHKVSNANLGLQLDYNYLNKYFVDLGIAGVHSAKLAEGHRNALSPSLTLGWKIKNEDFMANAKAVDYLTLSVSNSTLNSDIDIETYYMYEGKYDQAGGSWWGWYDGKSEHSTNVKRGENRDLTFVKKKEFSANIKAGLWKNLLTVDASYFSNVTEGLLVAPTTIYPSYFSTGYPPSSFVPWVNYNNDARKGFDFNVNFNKKVGQVDFSLGLSATYYTTKATRRDETNVDAYLNRTGKQLDEIWGLQCLGFYTKEEVAAIDGTMAHPKPAWGDVKAGDLKYVDTNQNGIVDEKDVVNLGRAGGAGAPLTTGVNLTVKYSNFTLFALGTGGFGANAVKNGSYFWVFGEGKYSEVVRGRWTESTQETATYPRLTTKSGDNNFRTSDFWLYKTDRFNLAKIQLTYDFPKSIFKNSFIHDVSAYVSGSNLLTIAKEREILELNIGNAPQNRFYNVGFKVVF